MASTRVASDATLRANVAGQAAELLACGVTTFECKSGYGLNVDDEQRSLRIAAEFTTETACAPHARWIDVFCERGAFDADEARTVLEAGAALGLGLRLHANQLTAGDGVQLAVSVGAASADHCTYLSEGDVDALAGSETVATLLPLAEFSTRSPYPPARRLLDAGATLALATDCNPGSSYSTSMPLAIALAVREMRLSPAEALRAATVGGAQALRRADIGVIAVGRQADLVVIDAPTYVHLIYRVGVPLISQVWRSGRRRL